MPEYPHVRKLALSWSLANLWYLDMWCVVEFLYDPGRLYFPFPAGPHTFTFQFALAVNVALLTGLIFAGQLIADSVGRRFRVSCLRMYFVLVLCIALLFRIAMDRHLMAALVGPGPARWVKALLHIGPQSAVLSVAAVMVFTALLVILRRRASTLAAGTELVLLLLIPMPIVALVTAVVSDSHHQGRVPVVDKTSPAPRGAPVRLVWVIFDEFDPRFLFEAGEQSIHLRLPNFDRFRSAAFEATAAVPPGSTTLKVLPTLITGVQASVEPLDVNGPKIAVDGRMVPWWAAPNLFRAAHASGLNAAVVGWMHPYCDVFRGILAECYCYAVPDNAPGQPRLWQEYADRHGLWRTILKQAQYDGRVLETLVRSAHARSDDDLTQISREIHRRGYLKASGAAMKFASDAHLDLVLLHLPIPHPYGIYDRRSGQVSVTGRSGYVDNLLLADRTLGELRAAMESSGLWDRSAVLISSDHFLRAELWGETPFWDTEVERATASNPARYVPYLLKLPYQNRHVLYRAEFNTIVSRDLIEAIIDRRLSSPDAISLWLDERSGTAPAAFVRTLPPNLGNARF